MKLQAKKDKISLAEQITEHGDFPDRFYFNGKKWTVDEEAIQKEAYEDSDLGYWLYDDFIECLNEGMKTRMKEGGYWKLEGRSMGWRNERGYKYIKAETGEELFNAIKINGDMTVHFYKHNKKQIMATMSTHDSPMGEYYVFTPIPEKTYEKHND